MITWISAFISLECARESDWEARVLNGLKHRVYGEGEVRTKTASLVHRPLLFSYIFHVIRFL